MKLRNNLLILFSVCNDYKTRNRKMTKQTSVSAAPADPAFVRAPNLSFLFFSFSSSSIWNQIIPVEKSPKIIWKRPESAPGYHESWRTRAVCVCVCTCLWSRKHWMSVEFAAFWARCSCFTLLMTLSSGEEQTYPPTLWGKKRLVLCCHDNGQLKNQSSQHGTKEAKRWESITGS